MAYEYYEILELDRTADEAAIKRAYRKKAMESHPDRHGGDPEKEALFKKVNEAYATLSDPAKRARYDRRGTPEDAGMGAGAGGFAQDFDFSDIFESFFGGGAGGFGGGRGRTRAERGDDVELSVRITFAESVSGVRKTMSYRRKNPCEHCHGTGAGESGSVETCPDCRGSGQVRRRTQTIFGVIEQSAVCERCHGRGKIIKNPCSHCHGEGLRDATVERSIDVPAGIDDGMTIKVAREGGQVREGGVPGDLYVHIDVSAPPEGLTRDESDLRYALALSPAELALGVEKTVKIPIVGDRTIDVRAGTQPGATLKFAGDGIPSLDRARRGHLYVDLSVAIPTKLSKRERELYEALAAESGQPPAKKKKKGLLSQLLDGGE